MPQNKIPILLLLVFPLFCLAQTEAPVQLPNFTFPDSKTLQEYTEKGLVLIYGDSACPACQQAQGQLMLRYQQWQAWGYPIVYIAMDSDKKNVDQNFGTPPWAVYWDGKSWDSPWVEAADIHGTPTLLALDQDLKQNYRAKNVAQMDIWLRLQSSSNN